MDMGIKGRKAIVCAASKGLGKGCAMALAHEGVDLVINARTKAELEATAEEIRKKTGVKVTPIAVDVTTDAGRKQVLAACPVAVFERHPYSYRALAGPAATAFAGRRLEERDAAALAGSPPPAWVFMRLRPHPASATALRTGARAAG